MEIIKEPEMLDRLHAARRVVLLDIQRSVRSTQFFPLALGKISALVKGNGGEVVYQREYEPAGEDLVCLSTLFTYDSKLFIKAIERIRHKDIKTQLLVGGIYATLMPKHLAFNTVDKDVTAFLGTSPVLDRIVPDYSLPWRVETEGHLGKRLIDAAYIFTSRGCANKCAYCAVWRLEPELAVVDNWRELIPPGMENVAVLDNNLTATNEEHVLDVVQFMYKKKKLVQFNQGIDCKFITPKTAHRLVRLRYFDYGLRLAFDRIEEDGIYQRAVEMLLAAGVKPISLWGFVLYNFNDTPQEADYRMSEVIRLGAYPYPQQYTPLNRTSRHPQYIGKHWTKKLARTFRAYGLLPALHKQFKTFANYLKSYDRIDEITKDWGEEDWAAWRKHEHQKFR